MDRTLSNFGVIHNLPVFLLFTAQTSYLMFAMYSDLEGLGRYYIAEWEKNG